MKVMDSHSEQGSNRIYSRRYGEGLQRCHGGEGALSCSDTFALQYAVPPSFLLGDQA